MKRHRTIPLVVDHNTKANSCLAPQLFAGNFQRPVIAYTAKLSEVLEPEKPFLDRFFPCESGGNEPTGNLLFERVFNNQNKSCSLIIS